MAAVTLFIRVDAVVVVEGGGLVRCEVDLEWEDGVAGVCRGNALGWVYSAGVRGVEGGSWVVGY